MTESSKSASGCQYHGFFPEEIDDLALSVNIKECLLLLTHCSLTGYHRLVRAQKLILCTHLKIEMYAQREKK